MNSVVPLTTLDAHDRGIVRALDGGRRFVSRMASLGFTLGVPLEVVQNYNRGPLIVKVRDCRIALGRGEADKVMVQRGDGGAVAEE